jgi:thioredoxin 1
MPTFVIFKNGKVFETIRGANPPALTAAVQKIVGELAKETATESATRQESKEENTVSGGYAMTSGTSWRMAL